MSARRPRVLIVDDDEGLAECLRVALLNHGYDVLVARDGAEGLARLERERPDVIVLDVIMPRRSGFAVLERIHRRPDGTPRIIVATGNDEQRHREFASSRGADAFLGKPYDVETLVAEVDRQVGACRAAAESS
jgi:DNA-binding response OmpR family regulator